VCERERERERERETVKTSENAGESETERARERERERERERDRERETERDGGTEGASSRTPIQPATNPLPTQVMPWSDQVPGTRTRALTPTGMHRGDV
jgi:hypothetical protein